MCCFGLLCFMKLAKTVSARRLSKSWMLSLSGATFRSAGLPSAFCAVWRVVSSLENQIHGPKYGSRNFILDACFRKLYPNFLYLLCCCWISILKSSWTQMHGLLKYKKTKNIRKFSLPTYIRLLGVYFFKTEAMLCQFQILLLTDQWINMFFQMLIAPLAKIFLPMQKS